MTGSNAMICIAGGGTGGHVMPALALADGARKQWRNIDVHFIGAERGLEARLLPERGEQVLLLKMHAVQGVGWMQRLRVLMWELPAAVFKILKHWSTQKPAVLVGVGGYASVAGVVAALLSRVPVVLYEQNAIPGLVNRLLYRFSNVMMLGFASAEQHLPGHRHAIVTGNVVRSDITAVKYQNHEPPCLLIVGGSQGAMFLNETLPLACADLARQGLKFSVIHLVGAGEGRVAKVSEVYHKADIEAEVLAYSDDMPGLFSRASLMISRAGAMTVCEAAAVGLPAFFVPLPSAADQHQYYNAKALQDARAAKIFDQKTCSLNFLTLQLKKTLFNQKALQSMSANAKKAFVMNAEQQQLEVLAQYLDEVKS